MPTVNNDTGDSESCNAQFSTSSWLGQQIGVGYAVPQRSSKLIGRGLFPQPKDRSRHFNQGSRIQGIGNEHRDYDTVKTEPDVTGSFGRHRCSWPDLSADYSFIIFWAVISTNVQTFSFQTRRQILPIPGMLPSERTGDCWMRRRCTWFLNSACARPRLLRPCC